MKVEKLIAHCKESKLELAQVLRGAKVVYSQRTTQLPGDPKVQQRLRQEYEEREYEKLVAKLEKREDTDKVEWRELRSVYSGLLNIIVSVVCLFFAAFYASFYVTSEMAFRVLFSLLVSLIVGIAEGWFFFRQIN